MVAGSPGGTQTATRCLESRVTSTTHPRAGGYDCAALLEWGQAEDGRIPRPESPTAHHAQNRRFDAFSSERPVSRGIPACIHKLLRRFFLAQELGTWVCRFSGSDHSPQPARPQINSRKRIVMPSNISGSSFVPSSPRTSRPQRAVNKPRRFAEHPVCQFASRFRSIPSESTSSVQSTRYPGDAGAARASRNAVPPRWDAGPLTAWRPEL